VHHALRAFTPREQKEVKGAAQTLRPNPSFDTATAITELRIGEALVSMLDERGIPAMVDRALIYPPRSRMTPLSPEERGEVIRGSPLQSRYRNAVDRESAYEQLKQRADAAVEPHPANTRAGHQPAAPWPPGKSRSDTGDVMSSAAKSAARAIGGQLGRELIRGMLGTLTKK
jgi:DNA helicase HerA-like ATPase